ncbi:MAG: phenylalanine--tRNA ligase subunit beta [Bacilli bacterium]|jgi:phenylalanyl-tRNA synthetase beta chain
MKVSLNWVKKYIDINDINANELASRLTFAGVEVEAVEKLSSATNLVIGKVVDCHPHPDSDHLSVTKVDIGKKYGILQIVCGAPNVRTDLKVIVAREGAVLLGGKISRGVIRGQESQGMICSLLELGVDSKFLNEQQLAGIEELDDDAVVGNENVLEYLGLDDTVLEMKLLANRSDLHSVFNIAREISTLYQREVQIEKPILPKGKASAFVVSSSTKSCPQFSARVIRNIKVEPSPKWLKQALQSMGIRSINNIVDIGNYIMLLTGQPIHMYDLNRMPKPELIVVDDYAGPFRALDDKEYAIQKGDIAITSGGQVMCLGGVMGSLASAVDAKTKNVVVEVANFAFDAIRRTSTRLSLASDSSMRFVKGINPHQFIEVMNWATKMIIDLCHTNSIEEIVTCDGREHKTPARITTSVSYINNRLGTKFLQNVVVDTLKRDWMSVETLNRDDLIIDIPPWRIDIGGQADISEEVIRIIGLDKIVGALPSLQVTVGGYPKDKQAINLVRRYLTGRGLDEVLTYSLVKRGELEDFLLLAKGDAHRLINPLTDEHEYLRLSIMPSLLKAASYNLARGIKDLAMYEVSDVDAPLQSGLRLGIVLIGDDLYQHQINAIPYSFYHLKGLFEGLTSILGIKDTRYSLEKPEVNAPELHSGRSAVVKINGKVVGYLGELHPNTVCKHELGKNKVYALEMDFGALLALESGQTVFKSFSRFPAVKRDLSFVVEGGIEARKIMQTITAVNRIIKSVDIFDIYIGEGIPSGSKSVALTITYERDDRTLRDEEVAQIEKSVVDALNKKFDITLRV